MTNGNDCAYGHAAENGHCPGVNKREYFAVMAMQGMFSNELLSGSEENALVAKDAVDAANALIAALNQEASKDATA